MTKAEALLFFPFEDGDELIDLYDERLFEYKQFFLSKTPIKKVFESKLDKLKKMHNAYVFLSEEACFVSREERKPPVFSPIIKAAFHQWEQEKSTFKQQLMRAQNGLEIEQAVRNYLQVVDAYRKMWYTEQEIDQDVTQISKDEDPMAVLTAIQNFETEGGIYFEDILKLNSNSFLLKEMKRLSLLIKNYSDVGSV